MTKPRRTKTAYVRLTEEEFKELGKLAGRLRTDKSGAIRFVLAHGSDLLAKQIAARRTEKQP